MSIDIFFRNHHNPLPTLIVYGLLVAIIKNETSNENILDDADKMKDLGYFCYENERGTEKDECETFNRYQKSADMDCAVGHITWDRVNTSIRI
ncbi:hypothetical protein F8M41_017571 [Gigaspora margarita]|uniref:Uncharacterized protein n=1 Tax=Gigaspora margarita TaxID=4874 RepID=A0A8H3ZYL0_GIGMA|nr:hypothetical protein F8M41_017571 [Gigaspora margarita]